MEQPLGFQGRKSNLNIDQYRAMKSQEQTQIEQPVVVNEEPIIEVKKEIKVDVLEPKLPDKIVIDGVGEVTIDELRNGYLRQSDYTKKTQEVANKRKEAEEAIALYEQLKANPEMAHRLAEGGNVPDQLNPVYNELKMVKDKLYDLMLEREIEVLSNKYPDFEVREVLEVAQAKKTNNLEDAYLLNRSMKQSASPQPQTVDIEKLKADLKKELLQQIEEENSASDTLISSHSNKPVINNNTPKLNESEAKVARMMKMSEADYVKWRDADKKPR